MAPNVKPEVIEVLLRWPDEGQALAPQLNAALDITPRRYPMSSDERSFRNQLIAFALLYRHAPVVLDEDRTPIEPLFVLHHNDHPRVQSKSYLDNMPGMSTDEVAHAMGATTAAEATQAMVDRLRSDVIGRCYLCGEVASDPLATTWTSQGAVHDDCLLDDLSDADGA